MFIPGYLKAANLQKIYIYRNLHIKYLVLLILAFAGFCFLWIHMKGYDCI